MNLPFDKELAQLAIFAGTGGVKTVDGQYVHITDWNVGKEGGMFGWILSFHPRRPAVRLYWTEDGKYGEEETRDRDLDLIINTYIDV